jgi:hypothetical protein
MNIHYYKISTNTWHQGPSLPSQIHHSFNALLSYDNMLILIGGIQSGTQANRANQHTLHNGVWILDLAEIATKQQWHSIPSSVLTQSAMSHCTTLSHEGKYHYCLGGSANQYVNDDHVFYRIDLSQLRHTYELARNASSISAESGAYADTDRGRPFDGQITWPEYTGLVTLLKPPPVPVSHVSVFLEQQMNDTWVSYVMGRGIHDDSVSNITDPMTHDIHSYHISSEQWTVVKSTIPKNIKLYNARLPIQIPYDTTLYGDLAGTVFFFGGEILISDMMKISSEVLHFDQKKNLWRYISHLPQINYGMAGQLLRKRKEMILLGGVSGWVGTKVSDGRPCYRDVYLYTLPSEKQMANYQENLKKESLTVLAAHIGFVDVTYKMKELVEVQNITEFDVSGLINTHLRDYVGHYWTYSPPWRYYEEPLALILNRNGYLVSMVCSTIYTLCTLKD